MIHCLVKHTRSMQGIECDICFRRYSCKQSLYKHKQLAHRKKDKTLDVGLGNESTLNTLADGGKSHWIKKLILAIEASEREMAEIDK